jgi:hypothetical protein
VTSIGSKEYDVTNLNVLAANKEVYGFLTKGKEAIFPVKN